jgi:hypothetical protein
LKLARRLVLVLLVAGLMSQVGCGRLGYHALRTIVTVAAVATVLSWHDAHHHHVHCGHEVVYVEERPVYNYEGRWEYYDPDSGTWYHYTERPQ